jgi:hypothetical protein
VVIRDSPDALSTERDQCVSMHASYGVVWRRGAKALATGKLELLPQKLRLEGMSGSLPAKYEVPYASLCVVRVGRDASDRIQGRPSLVIERRNGERVTIASVAQSGVVGELADRLAALRLRSVSAAPTRT